MNRLLLHGARYHNREFVFVSSDFGEVPDWRADRLSIRVALALREELSIGPGDVVALSMPLSIHWVLVERAVWGLGAATLPLSPVSPEPRFERDVKAVLDTDRWDALVTRGSVLDTPERASRFRAAARDVPPETVSSIESGVELRHEDWVRRAERFLTRFPPERGRRNVLEIAEPHVSSRVLLYAGWADGFTTVVLGSGDPGGGSDSRRFANLAALEGTFDG